MEVKSKLFKRKTGKSKGKWVVRLEYFDQLSGKTKFAERQAARRSDASDERDRLISEIKKSHGQIQTGERMTFKDLASLCEKGNYTLYGDISSRVHDAISHFSDRIENYSIDEAFAELEANRYSKSLVATGQEIRESIKSWTGIPTSIGIAPTKTLAKIAGDIAKKEPGGVFEMMDESLRDEVLSKTGLIDIWGINVRTAKKLHAIGVHTARDLRDMDLRAGRKVLTVVGSRMIEELRGTSSLSLELVSPRKKSICCSRSFAGEVKTFRDLADSVVAYLSTAAEKMRRQRLTTNAIGVFIETNLFRDKGVYSNSATLKVQPTDSTLELIPLALRLLRSIYKPGYGYRKSGVLLLGLQPAESETRRLFGDAVYQADKSLLQAIDAINIKHGRKTVRFGLSRNRNPNWQMARNHLSDGFTTNRDQILRITL